MAATYSVRGRSLLSQDRWLLKAPPPSAPLCDAFYTQRYQARLRSCAEPSTERPAAWPTHNRARSRGAADDNVVFFSWLVARADPALQQMLARLPTPPPNPALLPAAVRRVLRSNNAHVMSSEHQFLLRQPARTATMRPEEAAWEQALMRDLLPDGSNSAQVLEAFCRRTPFVIAESLQRRLPAPKGLRRPDERSTSLMPAGGRTILRQLSSSGLGWHARSQSKPSCSESVIEEDDITIASTTVGSPRRHMGRKSGARRKSSQELSTTSPLRYRSSSLTPLMARHFHHRASHPLAKVILRTNSSPDLLCDLPPDLKIRLEDLRCDKTPISKGTFGTVYRGVWKDRVVAVKWCHVDTPPSTEQLRNFERELNAYWALSHERVCRFYGACVDSLDSLALVTEFLPGGNAFELFFENRRKVTAFQRLRMARQLVDVLCHLHSCKPCVIHRDIKTPNLVLDDDLNLKLCDFGKTKFMYRNYLVLDDNGGSPRYMAPECFVPGGMISEKADIWSLACCLIEIFGGPIPHEDHYNNTAVIQKVLHDQEPPTVPSWFLADIRRIIQLCFSWDPQRRPSARQIASVLERVTVEDLNENGMDHKR